MQLMTPSFLASKIFVLFTFTELPSLGSHSDLTKCPFPLTQVGQNKLKILNILLKTRKKIENICCIMLLP
jgi:hypothetical protein